MTFKHLAPEQQARMVNALAWGQGGPSTPEPQEESMATYHKFSIDIDIKKWSGWTEEVANILAGITDKLIQPEFSSEVLKSPASRLSFHLRDSDGNSIGKWEVVRDDLE